jgi:hypothetical protein
VQFKRNGQEMRRALASASASASAFTFFALSVLSTHAAPVHWSAPESLYVDTDRNACGLVHPVPLKPRPLLLWLHGGMRSARQDKGLTAMVALKPFLKDGAYYLASPSAFAGADWTTAAGLRHIEALLDTLAATYPVKMESLVIAGVSDGSLGALRYAMSGTRKPLRFLLFSAYPQILIPEETLLNAAAFRTTRWDIFQGGRDALFPAADVFPLLKKWSASNPKVRLHLFPNGEHDFNWYGAHAPAEIGALFGRAARPKVP